MTRVFNIGSRGSPLALRQAGIVRDALTSLDPSLQIDIKIIRTTGDRLRDIPLPQIGGKGVFTKELEDALSSGEIDLAVHSLKDLPTALTSGLSIAAILEREDPLDAMVLPNGEKLQGASGIDSLPRGASIGTSSLRRIAQLKHWRKDVVVKDLRGNVGTRLRKLDEGLFDAVILASAGLRRLGLESRISFPLPAVQMLPAVGQGALAVETRADDSELNTLLKPLDHEATRIACFAERALLSGLGGGCQLPIAAYGFISDRLLHLEALVAEPSGEQVLRDSSSDDPMNAECLGRALADRLLSQGAASLISNV